MGKPTRISVMGEGLLELFSEANVMENLLVYIINYFLVEDESDLDQLSKLIKILVEYSSPSYVYGANLAVVNLTQ